MTSKSRGILMILSPAKTLDLSPMAKSSSWTQPDCSPAKTLQIAKILKNKTAAELAKLLKIKGALAQTTHGYWSNFQEDPNERDDLKPCIYSYSGAAYQGLQAPTCSEPAMAYLQENLRILDALYGSLRPFDVIQPYRLEMATTKVTDGKLSHFWKDAVTQSIGRDLQDRDDKVLLNLASDEYSSTIDPSALPTGTRYIKVVFQESNGRVVAVHAKRARGLMTRFLAEHEVDTVEKIQEFSVEGYSFQPRDSNETTLVFRRQKRPATDSNASNNKKTKRSK